MTHKYESYRALARTFGLTMRPWGPTLTATQLRLDGLVLGQRVAVTRTLGDSPRVAFRALLEPALDLGLEVRRSGVVERAKELFGADDVETGDAGFDAAFAVRADEPARARILLDAATRAELASVDDAVIARDGEVVLEVSLKLEGWDLRKLRYVDRDAGWLVAGTRRVAGIAAAMERARAACPPAALAAPLGPALTELAARRGLVVALDAPTRAFGVVAGAPVWVATRRTGGGAIELAVGVRLPTPLDFHVVISTARTGLGTWLLGSDVTLDDPAFDAAFDVRTDDPERLRAVLDPSLRAELLAAGAGRRVELDRWGLRLDTAAAEVDVAALPLLVERVAELVVAIARRGTSEGGPVYR